MSLSGSVSKQSRGSVRSSGSHGAESLLLGAMPSSPPTPSPKQRFQTLKIAQKTPHKVVCFVCCCVFCGMFTISPTCHLPGSAPPLQPSRRTTAATVLLTWHAAYTTIFVSLDMPRPQLDSKFKGTGCFLPSSSQTAWHETVPEGDTDTFP